MGMSITTGGGPSDEDKSISEINVTPLVDVMLVLLIIFLITIPVITQSVPVELPKAANIPTQTKPENINIAVDKDGNIYWNTARIPNQEALLERIKQVAVMDPQPEVHVRGHRQPALLAERLVRRRHLQGLPRVGDQPDHRPASRQHGQPTAAHAGNPACRGCRPRAAGREDLAEIERFEVTVIQAYLPRALTDDELSALIDAAIIEQNQGLLQGSTWGAVKICYDGSPEGGGIRIMDFKPMQTGRISLDVFRECRGAFTVEEWLDLIVRTLGYEPSMYAEAEKLWMLCRLIPLVQNRINLMELAPPGSGKSYLYNNVSRHVWLTAGEITPPVLFYNRQTKAPGLLTRFDVLVLDEAQSLRFSNVAEMQAQSDELEAQLRTLRESVLRYVTVERETLDRSLAELAATFKVEGD